MVLSISTGRAELGLRDPGLGTLCPGEGWGAGGPLSRCPGSGFPDLEDMSVMILRTQGPNALFDDHKLVLHTSSADAERARVFHACGELMPSFPARGVGVLSFPTQAGVQALLWLRGRLEGPEEEASDARVSRLVAWCPWHSRAQDGFSR